MSGLKVPAYFEVHLANLDSALASLVGFFAIVVNVVYQRNKPVESGSAASMPEK